MNELGLGELEELLVGPTAVVYVKGDPIAAAKVISTFAKELPALVIKGGVLDGRVLSEDEAKGLATVDSLDVSRAKIAGMLVAPLQQLVMLLEAPTARILFVLDEIAKRGGVDTSAPAEAEAEAPAEAEASAERRSDGRGDAAPEAEATAAPETEAEAAPAAEASAAPEADAPAEAQPPRKRRQRKQHTGRSAGRRSVTGHGFDGRRRAVMAKVDEVLEAIKTLTVLEAAELSKKMQDEFGIEAAHRPRPPRLRRPAMVPQRSRRRTRST